MSLQQLTYPKFYKEHGVRFLVNVKSPKLTDYNDLILPRESILHWVDYEGKHEVGPPQNEPILVRSADKMYVEAISKYPEHVKPGWVIAKNNTKGLVLSYDSDNPKIKRMTKMVNEYINKEILPLYTYGLIAKSYRYRAYVDSELNRWFNYHYTIFQTALDVSRISDRQQFIELDAPNRFPSIQNIKNGESGIDKTNIRYLPLKDHWMLMTIWNLIAGNGNDFIFSNYQLSDFNKINIIWKTHGKCIVMNMGVVLGFAHGEKPAISVAKLQRRFVNMFITLNSLSQGDDSVDNELGEQVDGFVDDHDDAVEDVDDVNNDDMDEESMDDDEEINPFKNKRVVDQAKQAADASLNFTAPSEVILDDDDSEEQDTEEEDFLNALEVVSEDDGSDITGYKTYDPTPITPESVIEEDGGKLVKAGVMPVGTFERFKRLARESGDLPDPMRSNQTIAESSIIREEDVKIAEVTPLAVKSNDMLDKSMLSSSLNKYNEQYIEKVFHKDILNAVMSIQRGGIVIKDYQIEEVETVNDKYNVHKVQIETLKGHTSTLSFKVPVIESDGTFKSAGSVRFMRKQRGDVPIRKVDSNSVALTSYYSKMFVDRSARKQFNYENFVHNHVVNSSIDKLNDISDIKFGDVFDNEKTLPRIFTVLSKRFISFACNDNLFKFNLAKVEENFDTRLKRKDIIPIATKLGSNETTLYLSKGDQPELLDASGQPIGKTLEEYIGLNINAAPVEYAEVNIFGKSIPLILLLGHHIGFGNLLKTLKLKPRREARNKRIILEDGEYAIKFHDEVLIFNRKFNKKANLIINGLLRFKNSINTISVYDLDNKSIYSDLFEEVRAPLKLLKESRDMFNLWVDPITGRILEDMKEPTDLVLLFIRAAELLVLDEHPEGMDIAYMRDKGYERISGMIYSELVKGIRDYNSKSIYSNNKLTVNPESVWYSIITDQTVSLSQQSNPIHGMKETETIIYSGAGGRSGQTMTAASRKYHKSNLGVTGEATVDSGDTGTIVYNVADPNYDSVYGTSRRVVDIEKVGGAKILSPSALLAVGGEHDDPKRLNFTSTQNSQSTFSSGSTPMPMRTGMEKVIAARGGNMFSKIAKLGGTVIDVTDTSLLVEYADGTKEGFNIGTVFGKWDGYNIPHKLVANVKKGDTFETGQCLYYNSNYFTKDLTDGNNVMYKNQALARTAFVENYDVYEDSAAMSKNFSSKLTTGLTHIRNIKLTSDNTIKNLMKVGDIVQTDSILCTIHSAQLDTGFFNEDAVNSLQSISSLNPKAKYAGVIDKINIIYTAELEGLTEELADIVRKADVRLYRESKRTNSNIKNGKVNVGFKIDGVDMTSEDVIIQVYISETIGMSVADKIVLGNQLKATVGRYWNEPQTTEDGVEIDLLFSAKSVDNRVVLDAEIMGSTNTILIELTKRFIESYDK